MDPKTTVHHGYVPDTPDPRDHTIAHPAVQQHVSLATTPEELPSDIDLSTGFPPVRHQGNLPSCTAFSAAALVEYAAVKAQIAAGEHVDLAALAGDYVSPMFVYTMALNAVLGEANVSADTATMGLSPRVTLGALTGDGMPLESAWPYPPHGTEKPEMNVAAATQPPTAVHDSAHHIAGLQFVRVDAIGTEPAKVLHDAKAFLAAGELLSLGFDYYTNVYDHMVEQKWGFAYPATGDPARGGGHAVVLVGFDDAREVPAAKDGVAPTMGAFLLRNSWGPKFKGPDCEDGYGWLPYAYLNPALAPAGYLATSLPVGRDVWALLKTDWN